MAEAATLRLSQERETPIHVVQQRRYTYRYAYARSADSRAAGEPGQDYLAIREDGERLAFALCDGVSQSFFGDLAARLLGNALLSWLWSALPRGADSIEIAEALERQLYSITAEATAQVHAMTLSPDLPPLLRDVLEQKRRGGSESTFVAGLIDVAGDRLTLAWLGDSRLRLWDGAGERTGLLGDTFKTSERWSSRRGIVGQLHVFVTPLREIRALAAYSDGLALLDRQPARPPGGQDLNGLIADAQAAPTSDDISFLEVSGWPVVEQHRLPMPSVRLNRTRGVLQAVWAAVPGARSYEVEVVSDVPARWVVESPAWALPEAQLPAGARALRVRALAAGEPGDWGASVDLPPSRTLRRLAVPAGLAIMLLVSLCLCVTSVRPVNRLINQVRALLFGGPTPTATVTPTGTPTATITPTRTPSPTLTPSPTDTPSPTATPTVTPTIILTVTPAVTSTVTLESTAEATAVPQQSPPPTPEPPTPELPAPERPQTTPGIPIIPRPTLGREAPKKRTSKSTDSYMQ